MDDYVYTGGETRVYENGRYSLALNVPSLENRIEPWVAVCKLLSETTTSTIEHRHDCPKQ